MSEPLTFARIRASVREAHEALERVYRPPGPDDALERALAQLSVARVGIALSVRQIEDRFRLLARNVEPLIAADIEYPPAGAAPELLVRAQPSDGLKALLLAMRTANECLGQCLRVAGQLSPSPDHVIESHLVGFTPREWSMNPGARPRLEEGAP